MLRCEIGIALQNKMRQVRITWTFRTEYSLRTKSNGQYSIKSALLPDCNQLGKERQLEGDQGISGNSKNWFKIKN